jgi:hypothetical protein
MDPLTQHDLETLGSYLLEHLTPELLQWTGVPCDHTFRLTTAWLQNQGLDAAVCTAWFEGMNIYCDCTILTKLVLRHWCPTPV